MKSAKKLKEQILKIKDVLPGRTTTPGGWLDASTPRQDLPINPDQMNNYVLEAMQDGVVILNSHFQYTYWNKGMEDIAKIPRDNALGKVPWEEFPFLKNDIKRAMERAMKGIPVRNEELNYTLKNDRQGWTNESYFPLSDHNGNITGIVGVIKDITKEKRKEELMQTLNAAAMEMEKATTRHGVFEVVAGKLKEMGFGSMIFVLTGDRKGLKPVYLSFENKVLSRMEKITGIRHEDFVMDIDRFEEYNQAVVSKKTSFVDNKDHIEGIQRVLPKKAKPFARQIVNMLNMPRMILSPLIVKDEVVGVYNIMSETLSEYDKPIVESFARLVGSGWHKARLFEQAQKEISTRKEAEKEARMSEERFKRLFEDLGDAVFVTLLEGEEIGKILEANPAAEQQTGYSREELIGMNIVTDLSDQSHSGINFKEWNHKLIQGEKLTNVELKQKKDGTEYWTEVVVTPIEYKGKQASLSINHDITERKHAEEELVKAKEKAEESDRLKSAFLANMSHEIRTPMNGILGFAELLREPNLSGEEQQEYVAVIEKSGKRMLSTINDLVNISKVEAGQMELALTETNVNEQLKYLHTFFKPDTSSRGIKLDYKSPLPDDKAIIKTDKEKLYAILTNLLRNAIKYTDEGSIEFGYQLNEDQMEFYVSDTGIGIPEKQQKLVFDRFVQADLTIAKPYEGSGLGLSIAKAYLDMLGGNIWLESEEGKGSTFYFTIPYNPVTDANKTSDDEITRDEEKQNLQDLNVLIVEDEKASDYYLSTILKDVSKTLHHAETGEEAINICRAHQDIHIILMDIKMSGMDGYEATRKIREFNTDVAIIAQTAYALEGDREKALEAGCDEYIAKPIKKDKLMEILNRVV
ncbi:MAG: PAS domain S-box protein [Bacteroidales bacterium]|nr:PAS domain S-box protein [Bacteroidales bacterium]